MKSSAELQQDLDTLTSEQTSVAALIRSIPTLQLAAAKATTDNILGRATVQEVNQAQQRYEDATAALSRKSALDVAIAETTKALEWQRGAERGAYCRAIADEYQALYADYQEQARTMLSTYRQLQQLNNRYVGMTNRALLDPYQRELNLPQLTGALSGRSSIPTGAE